MLGYWKALVFVLGTITILVSSNSEHEDIDFDELDKEIKLRRSYWKLSQARDQISDTVGKQRSTEPRRPITYFLYKGLTSKCLHEHLQRQHATNENITQALRQLQGLPSEYAEVYLKRNGKPHPFQNVFPDMTNISNNAVIPCDKYLDQTNPDFYRLFYGSQEFQC